jgi:methylmalonyl-CoA mutase cobalamin-binding domain/chain
LKHKKDDIKDLVTAALEAGLEPESIIDDVLIAAMDEVGRDCADGTQKGNMHDIGKNIVATMMAANGFKVIDMGINLPAETIAEKIEEHQPDILGLSALLTTTTLEMQNTLAVLAEKGLRDRIKIIVGGAPVDRSFANNIGADGYARDASDAVKISKQLLAAG